MDGAAERNRLPTLEWLRQNRVEGTYHTSKQLSFTIMGARLCGVALFFVVVAPRGALSVLKVGVMSSMAAGLRNVHLLVDGSFEAYR